MKNPISQLPTELKKRVHKRNMPSWVQPMLATLTKTYFSNPDWIFEEKFDGIRILAFCNGSKITLLSRNKISQNDTYPEIEFALKKLKLHAILDGEVVAFSKKKTSFEQLQKRLMAIDLHKAITNKVSVYYYVFDLLYLNGYDIMQLPLLERKKLLQKIIPQSGSIRYTPHKNEKGKELRVAACKKGWEGIMAKKSDSTYQHKRSRDWLKFKCINEQELVIGGYTDPQGERTGFGALLMGYYENGTFQYAGKVGTGYDEQTLQLLYKKLSQITTKKCYFAPDDSLPKSKVHWVRPLLVAQIGFMEWTSAHKLRHSRYLGLRTDKKAKDVVREIAQK
jgi:bifunctional non-homologous end joining protein LigD